MTAQPTGRIFGPEGQGVIARLDPAGALWRVDAASGRPSEFVARWPRWGLIRGGSLHPLVRSGHRGCEISGSSWPTPHGMPKRGQRRNPGPSGNELGRAVLRAEARRRGWPTPTSSDARKWTATPPSSRRAAETLSGAVQSRAAEEGSPTPGRLNPAWVEWLMGFPLDWTAVAPESGPSGCRGRHR